MFAEMSESWPCAEWFMPALIMILALASVHVPCRADPDNRPIVVVRECDIRSTWRNAYVALDGKTPLEYGKTKLIPITWGVITYAADSGWNLTWAQLIDYAQTAGGELASHSCTHSAMGSDADCIREVVDSRDIISAKLAQYWPGHYCTTFLQPGTWTGDAYLDHFSDLSNPVGQAIQATYCQSQAYLGSGWHVGNLAYRYGTTADYSLDYNPSRSTAAMLATLDIIADTPGAVVVFTCHGVQEAGGTLTGDVPADMLKAFMDRAAELRDAGKIRLMGMHDAFHTTLSSDLNHAADPGFERCDPGPNNPFGPVSWSTGCSIAANGGIGDSRYLRIPGGRWAQNESRLDPGRYRLTWWQKPETDPGGQLGIYLQIVNPGWTVYWNAVSNTSRSNSNPNAWEQKTALALVNYGYPRAIFQFDPRWNNPFGVDDISIVREDLVPAESPTNSALAATTTTCTISWDTPPDPSVTRIWVCWKSDTHPLTPSEGTVLGETVAVPGTHQELVVSPMSWPSKGYMYFSVFGLKGGPSVYTPPDLVAARISCSPPQVSAAVQPDDSVVGSWTCPSHTPILAYKYCVGWYSCASNVVQWTTTTSTSATISNLPHNRTLYLCAKAQNVYGDWSDCASTSFIVADNVIGTHEALATQDSTQVTVSGVVSAVFEDYYYIASTDSYRGLRIIGHTDWHEGDSILAISGAMTTVSGERALIPDH